MNSKKCKKHPDETFNRQEEYITHMGRSYKRKSKMNFICSECGKQLKTRSELKRHADSKCGTVRLFKCKLCDQELMTPGSLHNHMLRHNGELTFMCKFCAKMFLTAGQLKVHERIHTQEKVYICQICGKGFCHRQSLCTHTTLHTGVKPYQCDHCGSSFSCIGNLIKHRKTHPDTCGLLPLNSHRVNNPSTKVKVKINTPENTRLKNTNYIAEEENQTSQKLNSCGEILIDKTEKNLPHVNEEQRHENIFKENNSAEEEGLYDKETPDMKIENHESEDIRINSLKSYEEKYLIFKSENETISNNSKEESYEEEAGMDYEEHFSELDNNCNLLIKDEYKNESIQNNTENNDPMFKKSKNTKKKRKNKKQNEEYTKFIRERSLKNGNTASCTYCDKKYKNMNWLFKHEKEHIVTLNLDVNNLENKIYVPYKCSCCKMSFSTKSECRNHQMNTHPDVLSCQECNKVFASSECLRSHQNSCHKRIPRKTYSYLCNKCGYQFKQKAHLLLHERKKCEEGPQFECDICKKQFLSIYTRQAHMKVHDPEKKLLCKFCGKSFHWKGQLRIHERSHTGEKPYCCLYCPKTFAYRDSLITHNSLHTGMKPHLCEACGKRFSCIGNLVKHRKSHASTCEAWYKKTKQQSNFEISINVTSGTNE